MNTSAKNLTILATLVATTLSGFIYGPLYASPVTTVTPPVVSIVAQADAIVDSQFQTSVDQFFADENFEGLLEFTSKEIEKNPNNATAYFFRAASRYYLDQELDLVRGDLDVAISLQPHYVDALMARAFIFEVLDDNESAIKDYTTVLSFEPENLDALSARMNNFAYLQNWKAVLSDADKWIELNPDDAYAYYFRAMTHLELKDTESAIADLQHSSEILIAQHRNEDSEEMLSIIAELKNGEGGVG